MPDLFGYPGEANPKDIKASDPTVLRSGVSVTGTGDVTWTSPAMAANGLETFTGTGAVAWTVPAFAGTSAETFTGTGTVTFAGLGLAGTGAESFTSSGSTVFAVAALAGSGLETFTSTGAVAFSGPALDGTGAELEPVTGTGDVAFGAPSMAGSGSSAGAVQVGGGGYTKPRKGYRYDWWLGEVRIPGHTGTGDTAIEGPSCKASGFVWAKVDAPQVVIRGTGATAVAATCAGQGTVDAYARARQMDAEWTGEDEMTDWLVAA